MSQSETQTSHKRYHILNKDQKTNIILRLGQNPTQDELAEVAHMYATSVKNLNRWLKHGIQRKQGCGRKKLNKSAELQLLNKILTLTKETKRRLKRGEIQQLAIKLFNCSQFKASKAWQDSFIKAHDVKYKVYQILHENKALNSMQRVMYTNMHKKRLKMQLEEKELKIEAEDIVVKLE